MNQLTFENAGRTYTCVAGSSQATPDTIWWWVTVSDESVRYAAFHAAPKMDTEKSVKARVIAYHEKVLADRARPPLPRAHWGRPPGSGKPKPAEETTGENKG